MEWIRTSDMKGTVRVCDGNGSGLIAEKFSFLAACDRVIEDPDGRDVWRKEDGQLRIGKNDSASVIDVAVVTSGLGRRKNEKYLRLRGRGYVGGA